mgnify:CR=1 FL=1
MGARLFISYRRADTEVYAGRMVDRLEGKLKASQDEALPDRLGTVQGLKQESTDEAAAMSDLVKRAIERGGPDAG